MQHQRSLARLLFAACLAIIASPVVAQSTAFTYQGELKSGGSLANGTFDLRFTLFDAVSAGLVVSAPVCVDNVQVADGQFIATLDFGRAFVTTGSRFIQVDVRADTGLGCADLTGFTTLNPRSQVTASPSATYAQTASGLAAASGSGSNAVTVDAAGKVGIGTTSPTHAIHVAAVGPAIALQDTAPASQQAGYVSYRDSANVERAWVGYGSPGDPDFSIVNARSGGDIVLSALGGGRVGIGTGAPSAALDVRGDIRLGSSGQFFAIKSPSNDRTIRGQVNAAGTIDAARSSSGFTVGHSTTGTYVITFATAFGSAPTCVVSGMAQCCTPKVSQTQTTFATIHVYDGAGTLSDAPFHFIVMGP